MEIFEAFMFTEEAGLLYFDLFSESFVRPHSYKPFLLN